MAKTTRRRRSYPLLATILAYGVTVAVITAAALGGDWDRIGQHFFNVDVMRAMLPEVITVAARNTIVATIAAFSVGLVLAVALALMKMSEFRPFRYFAIGYIELLRGLPVLVTLILLAFAIPIAFDFSIPGGTFGRGVFGLAIVAGAYMAETIRGGIEAVPRGQTEAARSLGMSKGRTMAAIVLPQAFRIMIPPLTNEMVLLIKDTSLLYVIGSTPATRELVKFARDFMTSNRNATPLTVIAIVYLLITLPLTYLARKLEKRTGQGR